MVVARLKLFLDNNNSIDLRKIGAWQAEVNLNGAADGTVTCSRAILNEEFFEELRPYNVEKDFSPQKEIESKFAAADTLVHLLVELAPRAFGIAAINDFGKGIIFNPHPSRIRLPEDSAKNPGIQSDGSGLHSSLLALKRGRSSVPTGYRFMRYRRPEIPFSPSIKLDRLQEFFRLA